MGLHFDVPVKIAGTSQYYFLLQNVYDNASNADTIKTRAAAFTENLVFDINKPITLSGGYDCSHSTLTGMTILNCDITISNGIVTIGDFVVE